WGEYYMQSQFDSIVVGNNFLTGADPDISNYFLSTNINAQGGAGQNNWQYENAEVDALLKEGASLFVPEQRRDIYFRIQELIRGDLPLLPLFQYAQLRGHKSGLEGFAPNINLRIKTWNVHDWNWT